MMRNDAIRRSREMYQSSMVNTAHYSQGQMYKKTPVEEEIAEDIPDENIQKEKNIPRGRQAFPETLSRFIEGGLDKEKLTIIALMIILAKEGADMKLILALGYILM